MHYGVKGMKWGVRRNKIGARKYRETEAKLRSKMYDSGNKHYTYSNNKTYENNIRLGNKEDWRDYSRRLYKTDSTYKRLYDQYENDKRTYETFVNENAKNISKIKTLLGM